LTLAIWRHDLVVDNASHRRYRDAEAEMESWLGNKANTRAMYDGLLKLGLTPYPKVGIKHPRYLRWRDHSRGSYADRSGHYNRLQGFVT
jgi:hypothetical protein